MTTAIVLAALAVLAYTYVGYPLVLTALARVVRPISPARSTWEPTVSICMAVHDGAPHLPSKLESLAALDYPAAKVEVVVYCDGCTDDTVGVLRRLGGPRLRVIEDTRRRGKPTALNRMRGRATGEVMVMTDVRQPLSPGALRALIDPLASSTVGCVSGNLVLAGTAGAGAYWRYEKLIRSAESRMGGLVGVSGSIYAIRRSDFPHVPPTVILDDMWVPLSVALSRRQRIVFAEDAEAYDDAFADGREFRRKVRTLAGNFQLIAMMPRLLVPGINPVWFQLVSHKILRLACPWALLALLAASTVAAFGPAPWARAILGAQVFFYGLAALGGRAGPVGRIARTFVVLNGAAVLGLWRFARGEQRVTW